MEGARRVAGELSADSPEVSGFVDGLDYSMLIVTTQHEGLRSGCLVGFSTQTSIDPWRMLICLSRSNMTTRVVAQAGMVVVHWLGREQVKMARLFGEHTDESLDKFARCQWREDERGLPILTDCPAWLVGEVVSIDDGGDHAGFLIAAVAAGRHRDAEPLTIAALPDLDPGHDA